MALLQTETLARDDIVLRHEPFSFMIVENLLADAARPLLDADFPRCPGAGFFPYEPADSGPSINALIEQATRADLTDAIGLRLGIESLSQYPTLATICRALNKRHGTIHTDSRAKIATALIYLNESWPDTSEGCLRWLKRADSIDEQVCSEVRPLYGNFVTFKRSDRSFHGHLPFEGERRVIRPVAASFRGSSRNCSAASTGTWVPVARMTPRTSTDQDYR